MALLHRERPGTTTTTSDTDTDTVAGAGAATRPAWSAATTPAIDEPLVVRRNSLVQTMRTIVATALLVAVGAVAIANGGDVDVDLLVDNYNVPVGGIVGGAAGVGVVIGALLGWRGRRVKRL